MSSLFSKLISTKITLEVVEFVESLAVHLRHQYKKEQDEATSEKTAFRIPLHYFKKEEKKAEISPGCGFYMDKTIIADIEENAENNWRNLVTAVINEVYGAEIKNFSAKGRVSHKR
ncbi:GSCOCG00007824001-RA-CDS [Cotesia congregata]|nr:GSCOCG00012012001-RA-CDS [Cotesia congregata]CAD6235136.1 GSCOCG00007824001-RA-CDS [Cotesia congregata]